MTEKQVLEETIAKWNDSVNDISKFKFNSKEVDLFCGMLKRFGEMKVSQALTLTDVSKCLNEQTLENINNIMWESHMIKSKTFDKTQGTMIMQELEKWAGR